MAAWEEGEIQNRSEKSVKLRSVQGISMTVEQYSALVAIMPQLEGLLSQKGETVPRPNFEGPPPKQADSDNDEEEEDETKKANIEATSDEEE